MKKRRATALILSAMILSSAFCGCSYKEIPNPAATTQSTTLCESSDEPNNVTDQQQTNTTPENTTSSENSDKPNNVTDQQQTNNGSDLTENAAPTLASTNQYIVNTYYSCDTDSVESPCQHNIHSNDVFLSTYNELGQIVLNVTPWNESFLLPTEPEEPYSRVYCAALSSESTGIFVSSKRGIENGVNNQLKISAFEKGTKACITTTLSLSEEIVPRNLYANFINEETGFIFIEREYKPIQHPSGTLAILIYKTNDGGKTWNQVELKNPILYSAKERVILAKFANQNVGIISCRYYTQELLENRTYITLDGGVTWQKSTFDLPYPEYEEGIFSEVFSFDLKDSTYTILVRIVIDGGGFNRREEMHKYISTDLETWELINIQNT